MPERRRSKRVPARLKAWCEGPDFTLLAETGNLSLSGLFVRTASPSPPTGRFKLTLEELDAEAQVEVCWSRSGRDQRSRGGMGLRIVQFERGASAYQQFVAQARSPSGEFRLTRNVASEPEDDEDDG